VELNSISEQMVGPIGIFSIFFLIAQLRQSVNQEIRELIAEYNTRYLKIAERIPYEILVENCVPEHFSDVEKKALKRTLYDYFVLCEEQFTLLNDQTFRQNGLRGTLSRIGSFMRIRDVSVWQKAETEWVDGITNLMERTAIRTEFNILSQSLNRHTSNTPFQMTRRYMSFGD